MLFILASRLIIWFARDLLPLSMVEYKGFNDFWSSLHMSIPLPSRPTISIAALDDMYDVMKKELIGTISTKWVHCAMTFDSFTDKIHHRSYSAYTFHQVDDDWTLRSRVLKTFLSNLPHTAQNICNEYNGVIDEYKLQEKKVVKITDCAPNQIAVCRLIGGVRDPCLAHNTNTLIQKDMLHHNDAREILALLTEL